MDATTDQAAYQAWKRATPGPAKQEALGHLIESLAAPIGSAVNTYRGAPLPMHVLELEGRRMAGEAVAEWQPTGGMSLASYVGTRVRQSMFRYVSTYQNSARIPEHQVRMIGPYQRTVAELTERHQREPSTHEISQHMGLSMKHVSALQKALRADRIGSGQDETTIEDIKHDPAYERTMLAYYHLTPQEQSVFDYSLGAHGCPKLKPAEIAEKLKVSPARISALKEALGTKLKAYMD